MGQTRKEHKKVKGNGRNGGGSGGGFSKEPIEKGLRSDPNEKKRYHSITQRTPHFHTISEHTLRIQRVYSNDTRHNTLLFKRHVHLP
jgi:hypothetical protein